jgi:hypothetical protein
MPSSASPRIPDTLDRLIEKHHLLKHPFYRAWTEGRLSREQLELYAVQYYQHVRAFPGHLDLLAARAEGPLRELVMENLAEELDTASPHLFFGAGSRWQRARARKLSIRPSRFRESRLWRIRFVSWPRAARWPRRSPRFTPTRRRCLKSLRRRSPACAASTASKIPRRFAIFRFTKRRMYAIVPRGEAGSSNRIPLMQTAYPVPLTVLCGLCGALSTRSIPNTVQTTRRSRISRRAGIAVSGRAGERRNYRAREMDRRSTS